MASVAEWWLVGSLYSWDGWWLSKDKFVLDIKDWPILWQSHTKHLTLYHITTLILLGRVETRLSIAHSCLRGGLKKSSAFKIWLNCLVPRCVVVAPGGTLTWLSPVSLNLKFLIPLNNRQEFYFFNPIHYYKKSNFPKNI